jgi:hypothetical protein
MRTDCSSPFTSILVLGIALALANLAFATTLILVGIWLEQHKFRRICLIVACIQCFLAPPFIAMGVLTLIILFKPTVKALFRKADT